MDNNIYINRETFEILRTQGIPYTGFVIGEGYAFVEYQEYSQSSNGDIVNMNGDIPWGQLYIPGIIQVQCIDTSIEMVKKSLKGLFQKNGCATYIVCEGDTLSYIAEMFDVTVENLIKWNNLSNKHFLSIGQKLLIIDITQRRIIDIPKESYQGEIKKPRGLAALEMELNSSSSNTLMGLIKLAIKFYYDGFNAPVIWLTGHTLGGFSQTPQERAQAFIDFAPSAFFGDALRILGPCSKIEKGLQGYNAYIKSSRYKQNLSKPSGHGWQKEAGKMYQQAKQRFIMREDAKTFIDDIGKIDFGWNNLPDTLNNNK